uniref:Cysteine-rich protein 2-binding protein n=1 Tax=Xiphophorus couchianus TaxID=32473 RepID=A0A3B5LTR0_9TELE
EGLEEGEVEGETLLIVESEDQEDLSHDQSGDSLTSDLGEDADGGWACEDMSFYCDRCHKWVPAQLRGDQPSYLKGDNFFKFLCCDCSEDGKESFERLRLTWQQVVMLAMYNLSLEGTGRQGYFRWKEDICAFIGRHWNFLLGNKKTSTWWSTVAGCLSVGSPAFFRSGAQEFGEPGWWKLVQNRPPTLRPDGDKSGTKTKSGVRRPDLVLERGEVVDFSSLSSSDQTPLTSPSPSPSPDFSGPGTPASHSATPSLLSEVDLIPDAMPPQALFHDDEELETEGMIDPGMEYLPPPSASHTGQKKLRPPHTLIKREAESEEDDAHEERFEQPAGCGEAPPPDRRVAERRRMNLQDKLDGAAPRPVVSALSLYDERLLLRRLDGCPLALAVTPHAKRLRRKLLVRHAKRQRGLPLLDIDRAVSAALSLVGGIYATQEAEPRPVGGVKRKYCTSSQEQRILDRFQTSASSRPGVQQRSVSFWHRLMGAEGGLDQNIKSPYTARILKPFIRDFESRPLKLRLLAEIRAFPHRTDPDWTPEPDAPIDYCYVRPNHIPSVNAMCHDSFWPVDLSECLQYPDFSVVALYRKVVVGFGFMVPDVKYSEAYISFLLVHPEWRRAGIGTFMIYHLIQQTCMGKDVTLHVSASNPAMLLYQKFGFKAEEYILDFYDKYYPVDSSECRHAFFLRLRR